MRLISWNIQQGGGKRLFAQFAALRALSPDIVALQEVRSGGLAALRLGLASLGLAHTTDSFLLAPDTSLLVGPRAYGELIASKWPLQALPSFSMPWPEKVLSVVVNSPAGEIEVHTAHIPPGSSNGWIKIETLEGLYQGLAKTSERPRILCGDFNTPQKERPDGRVITWGETENRRGDVVLWRKGQGGRWDLGERNILTGLAAFDLPDIYRLLNGYASQEYSWYLKRKSGNIGRRFDHIFASRRLRPSSCRYLHPLREQGLSDHSLIEACFQPEACQ